MDRIMSESIILLDQIFSANNVDIMIFEPSVLFPPRRRVGEIDDMVPKHIWIICQIWFDFP